jgi:DNA-binding CsgD family transcriptional regulator
MHETKRVAEVVGRKGELLVVDAFLGRASEGFSALVLEGEAGIGKTTIWLAARQRAEERGFRVLSCRPAKTETKLALSAVADLLAGVPEAAFDPLPPLQRRAIEVALMRTEAAEEPPQPRTLATAIRSLLADLTGDGLLVAVDDLQWLDRASASVLAFALRRLGDTPMGWLFARRLGERGHFDLESLVHPDSLERATIGPLRLAALHRVVEQRLSGAITRPALVRVHQVSRGNPLYAIEIGRELLRVHDTPGAAVAVPADLCELLVRRVRRLPASTRDALLTAAALSHPTTAVVDEEALSAAEEADLVRIDGQGQIIFMHPLLASALYETAAVATRRRLHRHLAERLTDTEEQARHLAIATIMPDEDVAQVLEAGAAVARFRGAWDSAAWLLERARSLTPPGRLDDASRRAIAAAEHHAHAGDRPQARRLLEEVLTDRPQPPWHSHALRLLADVARNDENFTEAKRLYTQALDCAEDPRLTVTIEMGLAIVHAALREYHNGLAHASRGLQRAEELGDGALAAEALASYAAFDFLAGHGVDWDKVERALLLEDPERVTVTESRPSAVAALLLLYVGRHAEARTRLSDVRAVAAERGDESDAAFIALWQSWLETRAGDFAAATEFVEEAARLATLTSSRSVLAWAHAQRAYVHAHRGEAAATRSACADAAPLVEGSGMLLAHLWIASSLALLELSLGNTNAAWQACQPLVEAFERQVIGEPVTSFFLPEALEALIALGELERAETLLDGVQTRAEELDRVWALAITARCRGLLLAVRGDLSGAERCLERAMIEHERLEMPFERARTLLVQGVIARRAHHRAQAKLSLQEAANVFGVLGARLWAGRADKELERTGFRRRYGEMLTPSERRVAELAASGMKNREVAVALFISPKTVEANLARVYRKLGITTRAQLGARMPEHPS